MNTNATKIFIYKQRLLNFNEILTFKYRLNKQDKTIPTTNEKR